MQISPQPQSPFLLWGAVVFFALLTSGLWWMITGLKGLVAHWLESLGRGRPDAGEAAPLSTLERTWLAVLFFVCFLVAVSTVSTKSGYGPSYFLSLVVAMFCLTIAAGIVEYLRLMLARTGLYAVYDILAWVAAFLFVAILVGVIVNFVLKAVTHLTGG